MPIRTADRSTAFLLSLVVSGAGHLMAGSRRGLVWFGICTALIALTALGEQWSPTAMRAVRFSTLEGGNTQVVLVTRYRRHMRPAWLWEPMEREIVHTLHDHVLEGMRRRLEGNKSDREPPYKLPAQPVPFAETD